MKKRRRNPRSRTAAKKPPLHDLGRALSTALQKHQTGDLTGAEAAYQEILKSSPNNPDALHLAGLVAHQRGDQFLAKGRIEQAIQAHAGVADFHNSLGAVLLALGEVSHAVEAFSQAIGIDPANADAQSNLGAALQAVGRFEESISPLTQAVEQRPGQPRDQGLLGIAAFRTGRIESAETHLRAALRLDPNFLDARRNLASLLFQKGDFTAALESVETVLERNPEDGDAFLLRARLLERLGRGEEALSSLSGLLKKHPETPPALALMGELLLAREAYDQAAQLLQAAVMGAPEEADAHLNLGVALRGWGKVDDAEAAFRKSIALAPEEGQAHYNLGVVLKDLGRNEEAIVSYREALRLVPNLESARYNLGNLLQDLERLDEAAEHYRTLLAKNPDHVDAWHNLGIALSDGGSMAEAEAAFRRVLALDPAHAQAWRHLITCKKYADPADPDIAAIESLLTSPDLPEGEEKHLRFALGKIHDDGGRYDDAFRHYARGNALKRAEIDHQPEAGYRYVDQLMATFSKEFLAEGRPEWADDSERPLFIVGMLRAGTTLVESILAAHSQVFGAGELTDLEKALFAAAEPYPESIPMMTAEAAATLRKNYLTRLGRDAGAEILRVTDKYPSNFFHIGLIALLFPRARIVHCRRDPMDTALSIYFQLFTSGNAYAYDLGEIAAFYRQYDRLMAHWREVLPGRMLEIDYETLTADPEGKSRELIDFAGLDWEEACLDFHQSRRRIKTASAWQARQPVHTKSVARWKNYADHLGELNIS